MNRGAVEVIVSCAILLAFLVYQLAYVTRTGRFRVGGKYGVLRQSITKRSHPRHFLFNWFLLVFLIAAAVAGIGAALIRPGLFEQHPVKTHSGASRIPTKEISENFSYSERRALNAADNVPSSR
jgi:hypothetical protein